MKTTEKVLKQAALILKDPNFIARHRLEPRAFTRRRKLPFERIVGTLIHLVRNSLQIVCNRLGEYFHMDDPASKQAFSQARSNLSYSCFQAGANLVAVQRRQKPIFGGICVYVSISFLQI